MRILLPNDLEVSVREAVRSGRFASVDDAIVEAVRLLLREANLDPGIQSAHDGNRLDSVLGCMRDDAALMDAIVADAYRHWKDEQWRELDL